MNAAIKLESKHSGWQDMWLGTALPRLAQKEALAIFIHRYTKESKPSWAFQPRPDGTPYPVQFASDAEWLANTYFHVAEAGKLHKSRGCDSHPTWPDNPELRGKFG